MRHTQEHSGETETLREDIRPAAMAPLVLRLSENERVLSSEELLAHFQSISGRIFRNREDVHAYVSGLQGRAHPAKHWWSTLKQGMLLLLLALAFLQYYAVDVLEEVSGMQAVEFYLPPPAEDVKTYRS